jgi:type II secretion system protein H
MKARADHFGAAKAFTLLEIMMVVAIMGLVVAVGMPAFVSNVEKKGMRKALNDIQDVCRGAREKAILSGNRATVTFHPRDRTFEVEGGGSANKVSSSTLPDGISIEMLDINLDEYKDSDEAKVFFSPNGTSDEMTLILYDGREHKTITLEYSTALPMVADLVK